MKWPALCRQSENFKQQLQFWNPHILYCVNYCNCINYQRTSGIVPFQVRIHIISLEYCATSDTDGWVKAWPVVQVGSWWLPPLTQPPQPQNRSASEQRATPPAEPVSGWTARRPGTLRTWPAWSSWAADGARTKYPPWPPPRPWAYLQPLLGANAARPFTSDAVQIELNDGYHFWLNMIAINSTECLISTILYVK